MKPDTTLRLANIIRKIRPIELAELIKNVFRIGYREYTVNGFRLWLDPASNFGGRLLSENYYEPETSKAVSSLLRQGDSFLDVGANEGWFSVMAARCVGEAGRVFAMEPQSRLWPVILRNSVFNRMHHVTLLPFAIGAQEGEIELALHPSLNTGSTSAVIDRRRRHFRRERAAIYTLDQLAEIHGWKKIRLMKVDVEGFELDVLQGAKALLESGAVEYILVEVHPPQIRTLGRRPEEVAEILSGFGYQTVPEHPDCWTIRR